MRSFSLLGLLAVALVFAGCDAVAPSPDTTSSAAPTASALVDFELAVYLDDSETTLYFIPASGPYITCTKGITQPIGGAGSPLFNINVQFEGSSSPNSDCNGDLARNTKYLAYVEGQLNGAFVTPAEGVGSYDVDGYMHYQQSHTWANTSSHFEDTLFSLSNGRNIWFDIEGSFRESTYAVGWLPFWQEGAALYRLGMTDPLDVRVQLTYRPTTGGTTTITAFDGVGEGANGTWNAQVNTSGTATVRDELSGDVSSRGFTIASESPSKCLPSDPFYPNCGGNF